MYTYQCYIIKIIDGDTVDVDIDLGFDVWLRNQRVRVYGIDTPESRTSNLEEKKYGLLSKKRLEELLPVGTKQTLKTHLGEERGKFGRILGEFIVYDDFENCTKSVSDIMVEEYYAVRYFGQSKKDIEDKHLENRSKLNL